MLPLIESVKIEAGEIQNLSRHQARVNRAFAELAPTYPPINLGEILLSSPHFPQRGLYKARVVYDLVPRLVEFHPYTPPKMERVGVVEISSSSYYRHKLLDRTLFTELRALYPHFDELLLVRDGLLTDSTFCNVALYDGERWITPSTPLLCGTKRSELLEKGELFEGEISLEQLPNYQTIRLFNALNEWGSLSIEVSEILYLIT